MRRHHTLREPLRVRACGHTPPGGRSDPTRTAAVLSVVELRRGEPPPRYEGLEPGVGLAYVDGVSPSDRKEGSFRPPRVVWEQSLEKLAEPLMLPASGCGGTAPGRAVVLIKTGGGEVGPAPVAGNGRQTRTALLGQRRSRRRASPAG